MSEVTDSLDAIFDALRAKAKADPLGSSGYSKYLDKLHDDFHHSRAKADAASKAGKLDETQKANYAKAAKALPDVAKGLKAAITAFQKGDAMEGSAAIMDICSTVATVLGSMAAASSAAGPIGAFMGAVFGIVGMILRSFQPAQKGLGDVLEGKLRLVGAESAHNDVLTAIDEFESLYAGYPHQGPVKIKASILVALSEGNAADHVFKSANWLLTDRNIKEQTITASWLNVLAAYVHAECLQLRNLTHLLSIASADYYPDLDRTYKQIAKVHLNKMRQLTPSARSKGMVWHIGYLKYYEGGTLFKRQGADDSSDWTSLGGEQQNFVVAKDPVGDGRHVVALEGDRKRAYIQSVAGEWPANGTGWKELPRLNGCRDIVALPGDEAGEVYLFAVQNNQVVFHKVTRGESGFTVSGNLEPGFSISPSGETLLSIRVMPGYRPNKGEPTAYLLMEKDGQHRIQCAIRPDCPSFIFAPPWDVSGIGIDDNHLWIWKSDSIACLSHVRIRRMRDDKITPEQFRKNWIRHNIKKKTVLIKEAGGAGLTYLAPSGDGTLMVIYNARLYTGTPVANQYSDTFEIKWKANDPEARGTRVLKERIECWPLFAQHLAMLEDIAHDRKPYWDPTMRSKALS